MGRGEEGEDAPGDDGSWMRRCVEWDGYPAAVRALLRGVEDDGERPVALLQSMVHSAFRCVREGPSSSAMAADSQPLVRGQRWGRDVDASACPPPPPLRVSMPCECRCRARRVKEVRRTMSPEMMGRAELEKEGVALWQT